MKKILFATVLAALAFGAEGFKVITKYKIGGENRWDYPYVDSAARRLYVSHGSSLEVLDADTGKVIKTIGQLHGVHGIAIASELNRGYVTNGQTSSITAFDLKTFEKTGEPSVGKNPDAVCYDSKTKRVIAVNHSGTDVSIIDGKTMELIKSVPTGPTGEFCAVDGTGKVYVNLEDPSELLEIDIVKGELTRRMSLAPCEGPTGLSIDTKNKKLFPVCGNSMMAVVDIPTFKVIATPATGPGTDGGGFDPGLGFAYSANGNNGTMTIVKLVNGKYEAVDQVPTARGARTMAVDEKTHRVYLLAAEYGATAEAKDGKKARPTMVPDSFGVVVVGK
ncbi:MAG TPA: YncE family protein [Candidatus Acidoferrum sp.]|nr:YncE family protein [Candidatus Acidoferrum sp.]